MEQGWLRRHPGARSDRLDIPLGLPPQSQPCLGFRRDQQPVLIDGIKQRLDAEPVARKDDSLGTRYTLVIEYEGKLAAQVGEEVRGAVDGVQGDDELGVGVGGELVAVDGGELGAQGVVGVVDLAVDDGVDFVVGGVVCVRADLLGIFDGLDIFCVFVPFFCLLFHFLYLFRISACGWCIRSMECTYGVGSLTAKDR